MRDNIGYMTTGQIMPCWAAKAKVGVTANFANNKLPEHEQLSGYKWHNDPFSAFLPSEIYTALHRISYGGDTELTKRGGISSEVTILATVNIRKIAVALASEYALSVVPMWNAPEFIIEWLSKPPSEETGPQGIFVVCPAMERALQPAIDASNKGLPLSPEMVAQVYAAWSGRYAVKCKISNYMDDAVIAIVSGAKALDPNPDADTNAAFAAARAEFNRRVYAAFEELDNE